jgi:DnaJ-domain-containing protein 1
MIIDRIIQILKAERNAANRSGSVDAHGARHQWQHLDEDQELRAAIDEAVRNAGQSKADDLAEACNLLGVSRQVSKDGLRSAWRAALLKWHPDVFVNATPEEQLSAADATRRINAAYLLLRTRLFPNP